MSTTTKVIMVTGAIGTVAGVGYALNRYLRNSRGSSSAATPADDGSPTPARNATDPEHALATPQMAAPLPEPTHPRANVRINRSQNIAGKVKQSADELLAQALEHDPDVTLDELTGARLAASEHGNGSFTEHACIIDSELNRAIRRGQSLHESVTRGHGFGKQGRERPASTRLDPKLRHLLASRAVMSGGVRGVSCGSVRFFDPYAMDRLHNGYREWDEGGRQGKKPAIVSCDALTLLEAWSFDYGKKGANRCPPDRSRPGRRPLAWVGHIPGVDPLRLFLMKPMPIGPEHRRIYETARDVLERGLAGKGG